LGVVATMAEPALQVLGTQVIRTNKQLPAYTGPSPLPRSLSTGFAHGWVVLFFRSRCSFVCSYCVNAVVGHVCQYIFTLFETIILCFGVKYQNLLNNFCFILMMIFMISVFIQALFTLIYIFCSNASIPHTSRQVEQLSSGRTSKRALVGAVCAGVGLGTSLGVAKVVYGLHLLALLLPSYAVAIAVTLLASESMVCVAWDCAGVTTGPVTVPLILAMGVSLGAESGTDGFGILALASAFPIISVCMLGIHADWRATGILPRPSLAPSISITRYRSITFLVHPSIFFCCIIFILLNCK
jgi:hypothetical protein